MEIPIQQMSLPEYAELQSRLGAKILCRDGHYWRKVRPFFYRPLLPVECHEESAVRPPVAWPSGYQYVVANGQRANSTMNFLMLDDLRGYSFGSLTHKRRNLIKRTALKFQVRLLKDPQELSEHGHKVYLSFYERTRYHYKSDRRDPAVFRNWVDTLFSSPKTILLGGYGPDGLAAISIGYWVNLTLIHASLMCESGSIRGNLVELMFHEIRLMAAQQPGIKEILVRSYQGGNTLDQYYMHRGCRLVKMPARLEVSAPIQTLFRWMMPRKYEHLRGDD